MIRWFSVLKISYITLKFAQEFFFFFSFPDNFLDKFQIFFFIKNMVSCAAIIFIFVRFEYLYLFMVPFSSFIVAIFASFSASVYVCAFLMLSSFISKIIHQLGSLFY